MFSLMFFAASALCADDDALWKQTLERIAPAVVSIEVTATRNFDTESASDSQGTGFIVDAERGIVLTNRHMVHAGPVTARAVFLDSEEVELTPIYRDPVHDFGFYRFDPSQIKYMPLAQLPLAPEAAQVGTEIRVVGNDAGEKLSILDGTLARLDRNAPFYGSSGYNDFNTFYYQAASNTSGGSSGSPVIDVQGRVLALNAGGSTDAASSFYLPLPRVVRALDLIRQGQPIARGSLQATFVHESYETLHRLGLSEASEARARALDPQGTGLLVVRRVTPGGPVDTQLQPGDILTRAGSRDLPDFLDLEAELDAHVGDRIDLIVERLGKPVEVQATISDLHAITPDAYLSVSSGVLHALSYQQARNQAIPIAGVYVASSGYMLNMAGVPRGSLLLSLNSEPVQTLDDAERILASLAQGERFRIRYAPITDLQASREVIATMDRTWFGMERCERDDTTGTWPCYDASDPPQPKPEPPSTATLPTDAKGRARHLAQALVQVSFQVPYMTAGINGTSYIGVGVVVDTARGLVMVDRDTVPVALGDLVLTFGGTVRVPGEVVWLDPLHNFAVLHYDPARVEGLGVEAVSFSAREVKAHDKLRIIGRKVDSGLVDEPTSVERVDWLSARPAATPQFRDTNVDVIQLAKSNLSLGGVLTTRAGKALALWASYYFPSTRKSGYYGLSAAFFDDILDGLRRGETPVRRGSGVEWQAITLSSAKERGLSDARIRQYSRARTDKHQLLEVARLTGGTPAADVLRPSDLLVLAQGEPVTSMREFEAKLASGDALDLVVLRDGQEREVRVPLVALDAQGVRHVALWSGMVLHDPTQDVALQRQRAPFGVYVAWYWYGSPASRDGVRPTRRIIAFDDQPTPDLESLLRLIEQKRDQKTIVLTLEDLDGVRQVVPFEPDPVYWPTERLDWVDGAWKRTRIRGPFRSP